MCRPEGSQSGARLPVSWVMGQRAQGGRGRPFVKAGCDLARPDLAEMSLWSVAVDLTARPLRRMAGITKLAFKGRE